MLDVPGDLYSQHRRTHIVASRLQWSLSSSKITDRCSLFGHIAFLDVDGKVKLAEYTISFSSKGI